MLFMPAIQTALTVTITIKCSHWQISLAACNTFERLFPRQYTQQAKKRLAILGTLHCR